MLDHLGNPHDHDNTPRELRISLSSLQCTYMIHNQKSESMAFV